MTPEHMTIKELIREGMQEERGTLARELAENLWACERELEEHDDE